MTEDLELEQSEELPRPGSSRKGKTKAQIAAIRKADAEYQRERRNRIDEAGITTILRTDWKATGNIFNQAQFLGNQRAELLQEVPNRSYWTPPKSVYLSDELAGRSEVLSHRSIFALFHLGVRDVEIPIIGKVEYEGWLEWRDKARKDLFWLTGTALNIPLEPFHEEIIRDFYPRLNADGMFTKGYSIKEMQQAIARQSELKEFLLLDARGFRKTAVASAFVCQFFLNFPDSRVYAVSGTDDLAAGLLRIVRNYFAQEDGAAPSLMNLLFPEYTLRGRDAKSEVPITLPCRRYFQKDFSFETFGVTQAASGRHCDLFLGDDVVQEAGTEVTREKLKNRADTLSSNIPDSHALKLWLGTRYDSADYYSSKIAIWEDAKSSMRFMRFSVFDPKPGFEGMNLLDLTLEQVNLRFPNHFGTPEKTFAAYLLKMKTNFSDFCFQQMNMPPVIKDEDDKIAFDMDMFPKLFISPTLFPPSKQRYLVVDIGWEDNEKADFSVLLVGRIANSLHANNDSDELGVYVDSLEAARKKSSELALAICETSMRYGDLAAILVERIGGVDALMDEVRRLATLRHHVLPYIWQVPVDHVAKAKRTRIKDLELATSAYRFYFSNRIDQLTVAKIFQQFGKYRGTRSSTRKDDIPDACSLLWKHCMPKKEADDRSAEERKAAEKAAIEKQQMEAAYLRVFGPRIGEMPISAPQPQYVEADEMSDRRGRFNIPGLAPRMLPNQSQNEPSRRAVFPDSRTFRR